jgi:hypothetical protein
MWLKHGGAYGAYKTIVQRPFFNAVSVAVLSSLLATACPPCPPVADQTLDLTGAYSHSPSIKLIKTRVETVSVPARH